MRARTVRNFAELFAACGTAFSQSHRSIGVRPRRRRKTGSPDESLSEGASPIHGENPWQSRGIWRNREHSIDQILQQYLQELTLPLCGFVKLVQISRPPGSEIRACSNRPRGPSQVATPRIAERIEWRAASITTRLYNTVVLVADSLISDRCHPAAKRRNSAKKDGYETAAQSGSRMRVSPEAARPATAKAMAMR